MTEKSAVFQKQPSVQFWLKIYNQFDGILPDCDGVHCQRACCNNAEILIFPTEKEALQMRYGNLFVNRVRKAEKGYFLLTDCHPHDSCLFFKWRPAVCRTYPCCAVCDEENEQFVFMIDDRSCPASPAPDSDYAKACAQLWRAIAREHGYTFVWAKESQFLSGNDAISFFRVS